MPDLTSFGIEEGFLSTWEEIEEIVFRHENGLPKIWRMMIDTGGGKEEGAKISRTEETYQWIINNRCRGVKIFACKGASHALPSNIKVGVPLEKFPSGKPIPGGLQIVQINTDSFKDTLWSRIDKTIKDKTLPRSWFVHGETPEYVFDQICAEEKRRNKDGSAEWVQIRPDNHMLDLECLCLAATDFELFGGIRPLQVQRAQEKRKISRPAPTQEVKPRQEIQF
jgi:phage terminase large subunit GpA-like protein